MPKAFDKINWHYIRKVLEDFGFNKDCKKWIMVMVSVAFFSILLNGSPSSIINPSRGIRQGDPLSAFLFFIMAEGLSRSIQAASSNGSISGIQLYPSTPPSTHQQFVDDALLMGSPTVKEALAFQNILDEFFQASGTSIDTTKSKIFFLNTSQPIQLNITGTIGF